jgi:prevent-host-death family protein
MQTITSVEAKNNFGQLMNTVPREPVIITKHGKNYAMVIQYKEPIEFGEVAISELSSETQTSLTKARKLPKSAFINY